LSNGCFWMTEACLKLNMYENGGPRDHWRQIQIAKTEILLVCFKIPSGTCVQSFGSIAPAVTKRALLTDDDDNGRRVIV
jgi:hypothetical protein